MNKRQNKNKVDIEAKLFMYLLHLKEEKNKEYSFEECEKNIAYLFDDFGEFKNYFLQNGFTDIRDDLLDLCIMKTTKKGTIIALKGLCDYTIRQHNVLHSHNINSTTENSILDNLGRKGVETIINDPTPFPDGIYRPTIGIFPSDTESKDKNPILSKRKKK